MKLYGLIGNPLTHSFSKKYFTAKFEKLGLHDHHYELFPLNEPGEFPALLRDHPDLCGLNVTIPFKESIIPFLTEISGDAKEAGAVNTIAITKKGNEKILTGYNTDVYGFRQSIKPFLEGHHEKALILGTGGASKAVALVLKQFGIKCFYAGRSKKKGTDFLYEDLNENVISVCKLIVNCTPVGMYPRVNEYPQIPYFAITDQHLCYDLVYNPAETEFMKHCRKRGAQVLNGLSMLHQQAEKAWEIWKNEI